MCKVSTSQSLIKFYSYSQWETYIGSLFFSCKTDRLICQYHYKHLFISTRKQFLKKLLLWNHKIGWKKKERKKSIYLFYKLGDPMIRFSEIKGPSRVDNRKGFEISGIFRGKQYESHICFLFFFFRIFSFEISHVSVAFVIIRIVKLADLSRGWPEGSLFNGFHTKVKKRALLHSPDNYKNTRADIFVLFCIHFYFFVLVNLCTRKYAFMQKIIQYHEMKKFLNKSNDNMAIGSFVRQIKNLYIIKLPFFKSVCHICT